MAAIQRPGEACLPIRRPIITKQAGRDFKLTSTQELLGLNIGSEDVLERGEKGEVNKLTERGYLKEQCWKQLLVTCEHSCVSLVLS